MGEIRIRVRIPANHPAHALLSRLPSKERSKWIGQSMHFYGQAIEAAAASLGNRTADVHVPPPSATTALDPVKAVEVVATMPRQSTATESKPVTSLTPSTVLVKPQKRTRLSSVVQSALAVAMSEPNASASL